MEIRKVTDPSFGVYGKVLKGYGFDRMLKEMGHTRYRMTASSIWRPWRNWKGCLWRRN